MGTRSAVATLALLGCLLFATTAAASEATTGPPSTAPVTTRTTLVPGEAAVTPEGSPQNTTGLIVGLVAVGAIVIGAGVLYLRYRGHGNTSR
jgi:hypothetical protein